MHSDSQQPQKDPNLIQIGKVGVTYDTVKKHYTVLTYLDEDPGFVGVIPADTPAALELANFITNGPHVGLPRALDCLMQMLHQQNVIPATGMIDSFVGGKVGARMTFINILNHQPIMYPMEAAEVVNICYRTGAAMFVDRRIYDMIRAEIQSVEDAAPHRSDVPQGGDFSAFMEEDFDFAKLLNLPPTPPDARGRAEDPTDTGAQDTEKTQEKVNPADDTPPNSNI